MLREVVVDEGRFLVAGLASSIATCLLTLDGAEERALPYLREAFAHLRRIAEHDQRIVFTGRHERRTVASLLSFLLPDIDAASAAAGTSVRHALRHLGQHSHPTGIAAIRSPLH